MCVVCVYSPIISLFIPQSLSQVWFLAKEKRIHLWKEVVEETTKEFGKRNIQR